MSYLKAFSETKVEVIPTMDRFMGKYYNNALYNGIPWMILILHIIHYLFDVVVNAFLKKMRYKEFVRIRLKRSLWYLGFYVCSFLYCTATAWKNDIDFPNEVKFIMLDFSEPLSGHIFAGFALLSAFYATSFIWEGLQCSYYLFNYLFLIGFCAFSYFLRYIELLIMLTITISVVEVASELVRCVFCAIRLNASSKNILQKIFYSYLVFHSAVVFFAIPIYFGLPLIKGLLYNSSSVTIIGLNLTLSGWFISTIYSNPLTRLIMHQWHHIRNEDNKVPECVGSLIECALFQQRDDLAYNLKIIKQEIKERQERLDSLRRDKKRANVFFQTLKCMVAINRKIKDRKEKKILLEATQQSNNLEVNKTLVATITANAISNDNLQQKEENAGASHSEDVEISNELDMVDDYSAEEASEVKF